jgi:hypothetical protein
LVAAAGLYDAPWGNKFPRLQLLTAEELLAGRTVEFPHENVTFKKAPRAGAGREANRELFT